MRRSVLRSVISTTAVAIVTLVCLSVYSIVREYNDVYADASIISITPNKGSTTGGEQITITGTGFTDIPDYISNGLVLHLDGIQNTNSGHNASATAWEDLSGNNNHLSLVGGAASWATDGFEFNSTQYFERAYSEASSNFPYEAENYTMETYYNAQSTPRANSSFIAWGVAANNQAVQLTLNNGASNNFLSQWWNSSLIVPGANINTVGASHTLSSSWDGVNRSGSVDGALSTYELASGKNTSAGPIRVGFQLNGDTSTYLTGIKVSSVRVYNRALSEREVACNAAIDSARFGGATNVDFSSCVEVKISDKECLNPQIISATSITCNTSQSSTGEGLDVTLSLGGSSTTEPGLFDYVSFNITDVTDHDNNAAGSPQGGETITIRVDSISPSYSQNGLVARYDGLANTGRDADHSSDTRTWWDLSGNGNNATLVGTMVAGDWLENSYYFRNNKYFHVPVAQQSGLPLANDNYTLESNYNYAVNAGPGGLMGYGVYTPSLGNALYVWNANQIGNAWHTNDFSFVLANVAAANSRHSFAATYDNTIGRRGYIDGTYRASNANTSKTTEPGELGLGRSIYTPSAEFGTNARVSAYRIYDRPLSDQEVLCHAQLDAYRFGTGTDLSACVSVKLADEPCTNVAIIDNQAIECTTPASTLNSVDVSVSISGLDTQTLTDGYTYIQPIQINNISPDIGPASGDTAITITGTNLTNINNVKIGVAECSNINIISNTELTCTSSAHTYGTYSVVISDSFDQSSTLPNAFTYKLAVPTITNINPSQGLTSGGTEITITGTNFIQDVMGDYYVRDGLIAHYDGINNTGDAHSTTTTTWADISGNGNHVALNFGTLADTDWSENAFIFNNSKYFINSSFTGFPLGDSPYSFETHFTVAYPPISSATFAYYGGATNTTKQGVSVGFSGANIKNDWSSASTTFAATDATTVGNTSNISVSYDGTYRNGFFNGVRAQQEASSGLNTITGNFTIGNASPYATQYALDGVNIHAQRVYNRALTEQEVACNAAMDRVRFEGSTNEDFSNCVGTPSSISTPVPVSGPIVSEVTIDGLVCTNLSIISNTEATCITPAHSAGLVDVELTTVDNQTAIAVDGFEYVRPITIIEISPTFGKTTGGTEVTISGTGFSEDTKVKFHNSEAAVTFIDSRTLRVMPPAHSYGVVDITATLPDGESAVLVGGFTYLLPDPIITKVEPDKGPTYGGTKITITGENFETLIPYEQISSGATYTLAIDNVGDLWGWGYNNYGQANGNGDTTTPQGVAKQIKPGTKFNKVSAGDNHALAIDSSGNLWGWGLNTSGQVLGNGDIDSLTSTATQVMPGKKFIDITTGTAHSLAIDEDGILWGWGSNLYGQANGSGDYTNPQPIAQQIKSDTTFVKVAAGGNSSLALANDGSLWGFGSNSYGMVNGNGTASTRQPTATRIRPLLTFTDMSIGNNHAAAIDSDGNLWAWGLNTSGQVLGTSSVASPQSTAVQFKTGTTFTSVSVATNYSLAIDANGNLWGWGINNYGQANGNGSTTTPQSTASIIKSGTTFSKISAGTTHAFGINTNGKVWGWGQNNRSQVTADNAATTSEATAIELAAPNYKIISEVTLDGQTCTSLKVISNTELTCFTPAHTVGSVDVTVTTIDNQSGILEDGFEYMAQPVIATISPNSDLTAGGTTVTITGTNFNNLTTVRIGGAICSNLVIISSTEATCTTPAHKAGIYDVMITSNTDEISVLLEGFTYSNPAPTITSITPNEGPTTGGTEVTITGTNFLTSGVRIIQAESSYYASAALSDTGDVYTWGNNSYGQIGKNDYSTTVYQTTPLKINGYGDISFDTNIISVAAGQSYMMAIDDEGNLYTWGYNNHGQLGNGASGTAVSTYRTTPTKINGNGDISESTKIVKIFSGSNTSFAIDEDGIIYAWGQNTNGETGTGTSDTPVTSPTKITYAGDISTDTNITKIVPGSNATIAMDDNGNIYTWGSNGYGTIGDDNGASGVIQLTPRKINGYGDLSVDTKVVDIALSSYTAVAVDNMGFVYTWGRNDTYGLLGIGSSATLSQIAPLKINGNGDITANTKITKVSARGAASHILATDVNGNLYAWGYNYYGQIGDGTSGTNVLAPKQITSIDSATGDIAAGRFISYVSASNYNSLALDEAGNIYTWGYNALAQVGNGTSGGNQLAPINNTNYGDFVVLDYPTVDIGGVSCSRLTLVSDTEITCVTSPHEEGVVDVVITNPNGQNYNLADSFTYIGQESPEITEISPNYGPITGGTGVTIAGKNFLANTGISQVSMGTHHGVALDYQGNVYAWGLAQYGQIGNNTSGTGATQTTPLKINGYGELPLNANLVDISAGAYHTIATDNQGVAYIWGYNNNGQIGTDGTSDQLMPTRLNGRGEIASESKIVSTNTGQYTSFAIDDEGKLYGWGQNNNSQIGNNDTTNVTAPILINGFGDISSNAKLVQVGGGNISTLAVDDAGNLYAWGSNTSGATGIGATTGITSTPTKVNGHGEIGLNTKIVSVASGTNFSMALDSEGNIYTWGANSTSYGQLGDTQNGNPIARSLPRKINGYGDISRNTRIISVDAGNYYAFAVDDAGNAYAWGHNDYRQLGLFTSGGTTNQFVPVRINGKSTTITDSTIITSASGGYQTSAAIDSDGNLYTWGRNQYGQVGNNSTFDVTSPLNITNRFGLTASVTVEFDNESCDNTVLVSSTTITCITPPHSAGKVNVTVTNGDGKSDTFVDGFEYETEDTIAVLSVNPNRGSIYGNEEVTITGKNFLKNTIITQLSAGTDHQVALDNLGNVYTWGRNQYGQIGNGTTSTTSNQTSPTRVNTYGDLASSSKIIKISSGAYNSIAIDNSGDMYIWGSGSYGVIGNNGTSDSNRPVRVNGNGAITTETNIIDAAASNDSVVAVDDEGNVYTWGRNNNGQIGNGTIGSTSSSYNVPQKINGNGDIGTNRKIVSVGAGNGQIFAIDEGGKLYAWGQNSTSQIGNNDTANVASPLLVNGFGDITNDTKLVQVSGGTGGSIALDDQGKVYTWGQNSYGQTGIGVASGNQTTPKTVNGFGHLGADTKIVNISLSRYTVTAIDNRGKLYLWGYNYNYQIGDTTTTNRTTPFMINGFGSSNLITSTTRITVASAGGSHVIAASSTPQVFGWGANTYGAVGWGSTSTSDRVTPVDITARFGFAAASANVTFDNETCTNVVIVDNSTITCNTPAHELGVVDVTVDNKFEIGTLLNGYEYIFPTPTLSKIYPNYGKTSGGTLVTFTGKVLEHSDTITIGGNECINITVLSNTQITCETTASSVSGLVDIIVTLTDGQSVTFENIFTYEAPPTVISIDPNEGPTTGGTEVIITGTDFVNGLDIVKMSGSSHVLAVNNRGELFAWGANGSRQLGDGTTTASPVPIKINGSGDISTETKIVDVAAGGSHSLALDDQGNLYAWGYNNSGQIGINSTSTQNTPRKINGVNGNNGIIATNKIVSITAGNNYSIAVDENGGLWVWGSNDNGQLGLVAATTSQLIPYRINGRGNITSTTKIIAVAASYYTSMAIDENGVLYTWGYNSYGQIGNGTTSSTNQYSPLKITEFGDLTADVVITAIEGSRGGYNMYAVDSNGNLYSWGRGTYGALGNGTTATQNVPLVVNGNGDISSSTIITDISASADSVVASDIEGNMYTWGRNRYGQIGNSDTTDQPTPLLINGYGDISDTTKIINVTAGSNAMYAVDENKNIYSWGYNNYGQLGNNNTNTQHEPINITSNFPPIVPTVSLGGAECINVQLVSSAQITCTTTAHAGGIVDVVVTNPDGQTGSLVDGFEFIPPWHINLTTNKPGFTLDASPIENISTDVVIATTETNWLGGYTLSVSQGEDGSDLICTEDTSLVLPTTTIDNSASLSTNSYGIGTGTVSTLPSTWRTVSTTPRTVGYSLTDGTFIDYVYLGISVDFSQSPCDAYEGVLVFSAVMNP